MTKVFTVGKRKIGTLSNGIYSKEVNRSKHLFRVLDAWGIDSATLKKLPVGTKILIHDLDEDLTYWATKELFEEHGQFYHFKNQKEDHKTQVFLKRSHFVTEVLTDEEKEKKEYLKYL